MAEPYLTDIEFCSRYNISQRTAARWRHEGAGGPKWVRIGLRRVGYRLSDCEAWAASLTYSSRAHEMSQKAA